MGETQSSGPLETSGVSIVFSIKYFVSALACRRVQSTHFELFSCSESLLLKGFVGNFYFIFRMELFLNY
jgi:hypothetical protein